MRTCSLWAVFLLACGGSSSTPAPQTPAPADEPAPAATAGRFDAGCAAFVERCPDDGAAADCVAEVSGDAYAECTAAGQGEAYASCVADDCLLTLECGVGASQCWVACKSMVCPSDI